MARTTLDGRMTIMESVKATEYGSRRKGKTKITDWETRTSRMRFLILNKRKKTPQVNRSWRKIKNRHSTKITKDCVFFARSPNAQFSAKASVVVPSTENVSRSAKKKFIISQSTVSLRKFRLI